MSLKDKRRPTIAAALRLILNSRFVSPAQRLARDVTSVLSFNSADEEYRVLLPFIKEGFGRGEKAFHVIDLR
jgi:hypothetical protein